MTRGTLNSSYHHVTGTWGNQHWHGKKESDAPRTDDAVKGKMRNTKVPMCLFIILRPRFNVGAARNVNRRGAIGAPTPSATTPTVSTSSTLFMISTVGSQGDYHLSCSKQQPG